MQPNAARNKFKLTIMDLDLDFDGCLATSPSRTFSLIEAFGGLGTNPQLRPLKGLIRPYKSLIRPFKGLIELLKGRMGPLKSLLKALEGLQCLRKPSTSIHECIQVNSRKNNCWSTVAAKFKFNSLEIGNGSSEHWLPRRST